MSNIFFQPLGSAIAEEKGLGEVADIDPRLTRTHYFDGRLLTAEDLTRDQIYLDQRLREVGRFLGSGILNGLALNFDGFTSKLNLDAGRALTPAGRILELSRSLTVDLSDRALIAQLNNGRHRRFNRALYAVVLRYVEVGSDVAEVFPRDLGDQRGMQYNLVTESVQLGLVALPTPLPQQDSLHIRARLIREYLGNDQIRSLIPEDAVPLGVLAIREDRPVWLDEQLLRQPVHHPNDPTRFQADLARQYEMLFADVLAHRRAGRLNGDFAASSYFSLLPPTGPIPKESVDPVGGRQGYFPKNLPVSIAPIRRSDVALIKQESLGLPPIDLTIKEPVDIVVLAPLDNRDYGWFAGQLERNITGNPRRLPQLDLLQLKIHPTRPVHRLDTDASIWQAIWDQLDESDLFYVRRPTRAAETGISGIVLAQGTTLPTPPAPTPGPADGGGVLEDEETILLRTINLDKLSQDRPPADQTGSDAAADLAAEFGDDATAVISVMRVLLQVESRYDSVVWQTLLALARNDGLTGFAQGLVDAAEDSRSTGEKVVALGSGAGVDPAILNSWLPLDP